MSPFLCASVRILFTFAVLGEGQLRPCLEPVLRDVEVVDTDDWDFVSSAGVSAALLSQSSPFDALRTPTPVRDMSQPVLLDIRLRWLYW